MKGLENIAVAKKSIEELEEQKKVKTEEHRDTVIGLKEMGVNEKQIGNKTNEFNTTKRSETFNETLGPIEDEIKKMADEISNLRKENDIHETPKDIYEKRIDRLESMEESYRKEFLATTETGKAIVGSNLLEKDNGPHALTNFLYNDPRYNTRLDVIKFLENTKKIDYLIDETRRNIKETRYGKQN